ncbi:hypothetical protein EG329_001816 [Mollisiaceae sp. DMI_Dod_QoI]|nr:hypothetical protein EG329_001816 [Helotiales sp. DMI_Dod_QoI]
MPAINSKAVDELRASLSATALVLTPDSEGYAEGLKRWATSAEKPAGLVVYPTSDEDVSKTVLFGTTHSLELVVHGGGHSSGGSSSTDGGISIDLSKMRACTVNPEKKTITVQGGALWKDVDEALGPYGLAAVGGTVNHTGVGGLTLGGGYGWLTPQHGLTIDNLLSVTLVLANGSITTCSSAQNADLFWAARGAGRGFGVATSFLFQAFEQKNPVWEGMMIFPPTKLKEVFEISNFLTESDEGRAAHVVGFVSPPPDFRAVVAVVVFWDGGEGEGRAFYGRLLELGPVVDTMAVMPYEKLNGMVNELMPFGFRRSMKGSVCSPLRSTPNMIMILTTSLIPQACLIPIDPTFAETVFQDYVQFKADVPDAAGSSVLFECLSPRKLIQVPQTATSFANRGYYFNVLFSTTWTKKETDEAGREWSRKMGVKMNEFLRKGVEKGAGDDNTRSGVGQYANYDSIDEKGQVLFGVDFPRLVELKKRYDPGNVFGKGLNLL